MIASLYPIGQFALLLLVLILSVLGTYFYERFAKQRGIIAKVNSRSLHTKMIPKGGGIVFALLFAATSLILGALGKIPGWIYLGLGLGGGVAALFGFMDDIYEVSPKKKLIAQFCLSAWSFVTLYRPIYAAFFQNMPTGMNLIIAALILLLPIWFINIYNFIDGIDGLAITAATFICIAALVILRLTGGDAIFIFIFSLLASGGLGFLFFNLPPAKVFMGDSGSIFFGYSIITLALATVIRKQISIWTWIAILGYVLGDTTVTNLFRLIYVKKWYGAHRSHAYQNLARIYGSHARVTYGIALYHLGWALPCALWSALKPNWAPVAALIAVGPPMVWTWHFGPRFSRE